jgi:hypothetical protein
MDEGIIIDHVRRHLSRLHPSLIIDNASLHRLFLRERDNRIESNDLMVQRIVSQFLSELYSHESERTRNLQLSFVYPTSQLIAMSILGPDTGIIKLSRTASVPKMYFL